MNKKLGAIVIAIAAAISGVFLTLKYVNKATVDHSDSKPVATYSLKELLDKTNSDTMALNKLKDKLIGVTGTVKKVSLEENALTIELGDSTTPSSVICQIDERHIGMCKSIAENQTVNLKGMLRSFSIDTSELGFGNTIELNYSSLNKETK